MEKLKEKLIYYALKYKGDWDQIMQAIHEGEDVPLRSIERINKVLKCKCVTILDDEYPYQLRNIYKPPFVLFYYGDLSLVENQYILGVVGSRNPTEYGKNICKELLSGIENIKPVIVSGLARGIDTIAHQTALDNNFKTIAVMGGGIDNCYPKENYQLYLKIKKNGLLISEYPYKEIVSKTNFVLRNRLIAGLSKALFVPDVKEKSGTQITIRFALSFGKDVMTVPCSLFEDLYNNNLIYQGATPVTCSKDIEDQIK